MNLKQAVETANLYPELKIFLPIKYGIGVAIRKAIKPNTSIQDHVLERNDWLNSEGYEVTAFDISDMKKTSAKGVHIPEIQDIWLPWGLEEKDLKRQGFMLI